MMILAEHRHQISHIGISVAIAVEHATQAGLLLRSGSGCAATQHAAKYAAQPSATTTTITAQHTTEAAGHATA